jgi:glycosyltransferase involved in cell wall biosynthesis
LNSVAATPLPDGFSVVILTLNADRDLPDCLASIANCDDVVVIDSGSSDRTMEIAHAAGARVFARPFDNFASQRNYAQREIPFRHPWVFHLDADERMTPELRLECGGAICEENVDGFYAASKVLWDGKWLRRSANFPRFEARFVRAPQFEFVVDRHTQREAAHMRMGRLETCYLHDPSRGGADEWLDRHRRHAREEARHRLANHERAPLPWPGRSFARFFFHYVVRRGFLEGREGLLFCWLLGQYHAFRVEEFRRLRAQTR